MIRDYLYFLRHHVWWWVLPPLIVLSVIVALVCLSANTSVAGFVYNV